MNRIPLPERIETERLVLSRLRYEDAEEIFYTYASKPEATRFLSWQTHRSIDETYQYLKQTIQAWRQGVDYSFGIRLRSSSRLVGSIGIVNADGLIQFGYVISPTQWGRGYATEACKSLMCLLTAIDGIKRISTFVDCDNVASIKVLQKSGLVHERRSEKWFRFPNQNFQPKDCDLFFLPLPANPPMQAPTR